MIDKSNQNALRIRGNLLNAQPDRFTHFAFRVGVDRKAQIVRLEMFFYFVRAMTHDDDDVFHFSTTKTVDARLDYCAMAKRKQRFEGAHATRTSGGEKNCSDIFHAAKITDWSATVPVAAIELHASEDACAQRPKVILRPARLSAGTGPAPTSIR